MSDFTPPLFDHALDQGELNRNLLWKRQLRQRSTYRAYVQNSLLGDPLARLALMHNFQPLIDHAVDMSLPPMPPEPETQPISNQDLNW